MERRVQCVDEQGDAFNDTQCAGVRPADQLQCNVLPCDFCSLTNCAGQVLPWREPPPCQAALVMFLPAFYLPHSGGSK